MKEFEEKILGTIEIIFNTLELQNTTISAILARLEKLEKQKFSNSLN